MKTRTNRLVSALCGAVVVALMLIPMAATVVAAEDGTLGALWEKLSDGGRVAIKTASGKVGTTLQTVKDSPNAKFWGELGSRGLLRSVMLVEIFGAEAEVFEKAGMIAFAVTPMGVESIPGLVKDLEKK